MIWVWFVQDLGDALCNQTAMNIANNQFSMKGQTILRWLTFYIKNKVMAKRIISSCVTSSGKVISLLKRFREVFPCLVTGGQN